MNNSLGHLTDNYYVVTEAEALKFQEDIHESLVRQMSEEEKEASNKAVQMASSNGLTPFATPSKDKKLSNAQILISERFDGVNQARHLEATGTSSTAYALAAVKRATSMTRIFINKTTLKCETHQERLFHMELYAYLIDGLPKQLLQKTVVGDICTVYLKIMALGQTNASATRRKLNNLMNNLAKGANSWPNYLQSFYDISDAQEASGVDSSEEDLLCCLINGLTLDARYKDVIREIECSRTPLSLSAAINLITAHAIHCHDDQLLPPATESSYNLEAKAASTPKAPCRKFQQHLPCYHDPCPYEHIPATISPGTSPHGASPNDAGRDRQKSSDQKPRRACRALVELKECKFRDKCRYSHDPKLVDTARQAFAGCFEADDYFAEANCIEEVSQPQPIIMKVKESNPLGKFRDPQGSPKDRLRKPRKQRNLFFRNKTYPLDPPTSQDAGSNLPTFDDPDVRDSQAHEHAGEKSAIRLIETEYGEPIFPLSWEQATTPSIEHVEAVDLATAYYQIPIASMNSSSYDWTKDQGATHCNQSSGEATVGSHRTLTCLVTSRLPLSHPFDWRVLNTETAFAISSKQSTQDRSEPMPAVFDTGGRHEEKRRVRETMGAAVFLMAAICLAYVSAYAVLRVYPKQGNPFDNRPFDLNDLISSATERHQEPAHSSTMEKSIGKSPPDFLSVKPDGPHQDPAGDQFCQIKQTTFDLPLSKDQGATHQ
jgi:hypothetical protein